MLPRERGQRNHALRISTYRYFNRSYPEWICWLADWKAVAYQGAARISNISPRSWEWPGQESLRTAMATCRRWSGPRPSRRTLRMSPVRHRCSTDPAEESHQRVTIHWSEKLPEIDPSRHLQTYGLSDNLTVAMMLQRRYTDITGSIEAFVAFGRSQWLRYLHHRVLSRNRHQIRQQSLHFNRSLLILDQHFAPWQKITAQLSWQLVKKIQVSRSHVARSEHGRIYTHAWHVCMRVSSVEEAEQTCLCINFI